MLDEAHVRDAYGPGAAYKDPVDLLVLLLQFESDGVVGRRGLEPLTPCASCKCATSCANGPIEPQGYQIAKQTSSTYPWPRCTRAQRLDANL